MTTSPVSPSVSVADITAALTAIVAGELRIDGVEHRIILRPQITRRLHAQQQDGNMRGPELRKNRGNVSSGPDRIKTAPKVVLNNVKVSELRRHLPAQTEHVTPFQRSESLRARMLATARRYRE